MVIRFGDFTLDSGSRQVARAGEPVHLSRKAFDALRILIERRPGAVTKEEQHARLWPETFVVDANLSVVVAEIRRALGDDPQAPRFIRTLHRVGYAFCGDLQTTPEPTATGPAPDVWLVHGGRVLPLIDGDNLIGRDPACPVWLDVSGVSRRHACIRVAGDRATIEDLGSKNGTFLGDVPVADARSLMHGDRIRIGVAEIEFRRRADSRATETVRLEGRGVR